VLANTLGGEWVVLLLRPVAPAAPGIMLGRPDVAPFSNRNRNGKKALGVRLGGWAVCDSSGGKAVIFDNTCFCHPSGCYRKCARRNCNAKVLFGQSTLGPAATGCRGVKYDRGGPGCRGRGQLLLPLVNTFLGAFIATGGGVA